MKNRLEKADFFYCSRTSIVYNSCPTLWDQSKFHYWAGEGQEFDCCRETPIPAVNPCLLNYFLARMLSTRLKSKMFRDRSNPKEAILVPGKKNLALKS